MYNVYRLTALGKYFYVYSDKGINELRTELEPTTMVSGLSLEEARVVTIALLEEQLDKTEGLSIKHIQLGWHVYRFNRKGKVEYCSSDKGLSYFDVELEPVMIACNINQYGADLIAKALITQIENAQFENKVPQHLIDHVMSTDETIAECRPLNKFKVIAVNVASDNDQRYVLMTTDKGDTIEVSMSNLSNNLSIETLNIEYLKNKIPFDYNIMGNELIRKAAFKPMTKVTIVAVKIISSQKHKYAHLTSDKGEVIEVRMSHLAKYLSLSTLTAEYLKNLIPFEYTKTGNEIILKTASKPEVKDDNENNYPKYDNTKSFAENCGLSVKIVSVSDEISVEGIVYVLVTTSGEIIKLNPFDLMKRLKISEVSLNYLKASLPFELPNAESDDNGSPVKLKGIVPRRLNEQRYMRERFYEICEAVIEFKQANIKIPKEWLTELDEMFSDQEVLDLLEESIC